MNAIVRTCAVLALVAGIAATPPPVYVITVYAQAASVTAKFVVDGKASSAFVAQGKKRDFDYASVPGKMTFEITGCGHTQSKTIIVPPGHPGALFTVRTGCLIEIGSR